MKRRLYSLLFALALLPACIAAQTTVRVVDAGRTYLDDGDGKGLYINLTSSVSTTDGTFAPPIKCPWINNALKNKYNGGKEKFYKKDMDAITSLSTISEGDIHIDSPNSTAFLLGMWSRDLLKYLPNVKTLEVSFDTHAARYIDVSGSKVETIKIPTGTSNMHIYVVAGDGDAIKRTVDVSGNTQIGMLSCSGTEITSVKFNSECSALKAFSIRGSGIRGVLDLRSLPSLLKVDIACSEIEELNVEGMTALGNIRISPESNLLNGSLIVAAEYRDALNQNDGRDYLGKYKFFNYDPATGRGTRLKKINMKGCKNVKRLLVNNESPQNQKFEFTALEEINAEGCTSLTEIRAINGQLSKLNVKGCTSLTTVRMMQNKLTTEALLEGGIAACPIRELNLHRNRLTDIDFMLQASSRWPQEWKTLAGTYLRTDDNVRLIEKLWVNGGSIVRREYIGDDPSVYTGPYKVEDAAGLNIGITGYYAWWIEPGDEFTNTISSINFRDIAENLKYIHCSDNLITNFNMPPNEENLLEEIECSNNMLAMMNLSFVDATKLRNSNWKNQISFRDLAVLKGGTGEFSYGVHGAGVMREDGENDMVLLPLGGYNGDVWDLSVGPEDPADKRTDSHNFNPAVLNSDGMADICFPISLYDGSYGYLKLFDGATHTGGDIDMHRMLVTFKSSTGLKNGSTATAGFKDYIEPKVHTEPYIVYLNPVFRSPYNKIDYYSGTVCLNYEWEVPKGLEAYIAAGIRNVKYITQEGSTAADGQLNLVRIGVEGDVIPENTPVYLRTVPAFENVVKADGKTAAKKTNGKSHMAGFYALNGNWDYEYLGWQNTKANEISDRVYLKKRMGKKPTVMGNYVTIDGKRTKIDADLLYNRNLLKCYSVEDETPVDAYHYIDNGPANKHFWNFPSIETVDNDGKTDIRNNVLTLGREKKIGTQMIGFWPYTGTTIPPHRCYIKISDVIDLLSASSGGTKSLSNGLTFSFDESEETGIMEFAASDDSGTRDNAWYTLSGMRLPVKPTQPGMYVNNGKKVYIK